MYSHPETRVQAVFVVFFAASSRASAASVSSTKASSASGDVSFAASLAGALLGGSFLLLEHLLMGRCGALGADEAVLANGRHQLILDDGGGFGDACSGPDRS